MPKKEEFDLIITIVNRGFSDYVVDAARGAGATGATIITGRGNSIHENDKFLGVSIQPEKELVLVIVKKSERNKIIKEICLKANLNKEGKGLCFSMPVTNLQGITHLLGNVSKK